MKYAPLGLFSLTLAGLLLGAPVSCAGTTGGEKFEFEAVIGGAERDPAQPLVFTNDYGWEVALTQADLFLGPVYLNTISPLGGQTTWWQRWSPVRSAFADPAHLGGGRVVGELLGQVSFSALSPSLVPFPVRGVISSDEVRSAEIFFYPLADVSPETSQITVAALSFAGSAVRGDESYKFRGKLVLNDDWMGNASAGDLDNRSISSIRQVRGIVTGFQPEPGGRLEIRVDVPRLFAAADFSDLSDNPFDLTDPTARALVQAKSGKFSTDQVMRVLFENLRSTRDVYAVSWRPAP